MPSEPLIAVSEFCLYHHIEIAFVYALEQQGLVQTTTIEQAVYVQPEQLVRLEKFVRLHQDLAIHPDDLDIVNNLLEQVERLQEQVSQLQNRLLFYD